MPIINAGSLSASQIIAIVQEALAQHRAALERVNEVFAWTSSISAADLEAPPISMAAADANAILAAVADAHGEYLIHTAGSDPNHPINPPYVYANSQTAVLGPLA